MNNSQSGIIAWFTRNPVAANLLMCTIFLAGLLSVYSIKKEYIPEMALEMISITIEYPGAAPDEIEYQVTSKIEEAIAGIEGIKKVESVVYEGYSETTAHIQVRHKSDKVLSVIERAIGEIATFPDSVKKPVISEITLKEGVLWLILSGDLDEHVFKHFARDIKNELVSLPQISQVEIEGVRDYEIAIEVNKEVLQQYGLTIAEVADAIRNSSFDLPIGSIKSKGGEILLRAKQQAFDKKAFADIKIDSALDGTVLRVGDIATVRDGFEETDWFLHFQGKKAVGLQVFRVGKQSLLKVAETVNNYVDQKRDELPEGVQLSIIADTSVPLKERLQMMIKNILFGSLLVFVALALFLRIRIAFWVMIGLPLCFLGSIWLMDTSFVNVSINMLSLFGFILVLGIIVDDAIVIGENIYTTVQKKGGGINQVINGAKEVALPATFGVLTTMAAFLPIFMLPGVNGKLWTNIGWVVVLCLLFSLIESKLILPAHLSRINFNKKPGRWRLPITWLQAKISKGLSTIITKIYAPTLDWALHWRYTVLAIFAALIVVTAALISSKTVRVVFFPEIESDMIEINLKMAGGTPFEMTTTMAKRVEDAVDVVNSEYQKESGTKDNLIRFVISFSQSETAVWFYAELLPTEKRDLSTKDVINRWRERTGTIPGALRLVFSGSEDDGGSPINFQIKGSDFAKMDSVAKALQDKLESFEGVFDIRDSYEPGKKELALKLQQNSETLGLRFSSIANQIRSGFFGEKVQTLHRGSDEVDVYIRYPLKQRKSLSSLSEMRLETDNNNSLVLGDIANTSMQRGASNIYRINRQRVIEVTANIDKGEISAQSITDEIKKEYLPDLLQQYRGVRCTTGGQIEEDSEVIAVMKKGSLLAAFIIFSLMAIPLRSYFQPLLIMTAIPFGTVGAIWGHYFMGLPVSVLSLCGIIALSGVVVNDGLVMVDHINKQRRKGRSFLEAIKASGAARFRPILLTSLTTFVGLAPMLSEKSLQAQFLIPMAVSLAFGILFATVITLYLIPSLYLVGQDIAALISQSTSKNRSMTNDMNPLHEENQ